MEKTIHPARAIPESCFAPRQGSCTSGAIGVERVTFGQRMKSLAARMRSLFKPRPREVRMEKPGLSPELACRIRQFSRLLEPELLGKTGMLDLVRRSGDEEFALVPLSDFEYVMRAARTGAFSLNLPRGSDVKVRTGTLVMHEADGKCLGGEIVSGGCIASPERLVYRVPPRFRGKRGWLVIESPDFDIVETTEGLVVEAAESSVMHVENAPAYSGTFVKDPLTGVPVGDRLKDGGAGNADVVYVHNKHEPCIDLVVLSANNHSIYLDILLSDHLMALVRDIITPQNYVEKVVGTLKTTRNGNIGAFGIAWAREDPALAQGLHEAGIAGF